jgi:hypothetical protein
VCLRCATSTRPEPFARPLFDGELTAELVLNLGSGPNAGPACLTIQSVPVLLTVERLNTATGIWAMVWTRQDDDPRLLESKQFKGPAALKVWLAGIVTRYGRSNITVNWTAALRTDERVSAALRETGLD